MRYRFGFSAALALLALVVLGLNGLAAAGNQTLAAGARALAKPAPPAPPPVSPGMKLVFELPDAVRVVNPQPVVSPSQRYQYGDICHVEAGRQADVIALTNEKSPRALLRLGAVANKDARFNCPADTLLFLPVETVQEMIKRRQERLDREAAEKDLVRRLLRQERSH